ncbi:MULTISPECIES: hypothetical protein [Bacillus cereus group]|nr:MULTISPECIES: hypothetical protein [Bacillus cereus group]MCC2414292.1 hypothetical protein [Bacillus paranthracis]MDX5923208.1 hypothetical protein [Bacillus cereus group sp. BfR-BA-01033]MDX5975784.1 hypothetical protein [Bacillus cereus group sp. BfR-BA-00287]
MGKVGSLARTLQEERLRFTKIEVFNPEVLEEIAKPKNYNDRSHLFEIGKPISEMVFHAKPKQIRSTKKQIELYFDWLKEAKDYRTRRIVTGNLIMDHFEIVTEQAYKLMSAERQGKCKVGEVDILEFNLDEMDENPLWMEAMFSALDPVECYTYFMHSKKQDPKEREELKKFAEKHGVFSKVEAYLEQKPLMKQDFYTYERARKYVNKDTKYKEKMYLCTSVVYVKKKEKDYKRRAERVTELSLFFCEVDHYKVEEYKHLSSREVTKLMLKDLEANNIPRPTEEIYSQGPQLVWKHSPIPEYRWTEWVIVQEKIHSVLAKYGADRQTTRDRVRFLRAAGTIHEKLHTKIIGYSYTDDRYLFDDFIEKVCKEEIEKERERRRKNREKYLKWLEKQEKKEQKEDEKQETFLEVIEGKGIKPEKDTISKEHQGLNAAFHQRYIRDIKTLVSLRNGQMEGYREFVCFLTRYWVLCITDGNDLKALNEMKSIYDLLEIQGKYTFDEMITYTSSALTGFNNWKKDQKKGYNYNNRKLCRTLEMTPEEQQRMSILMDVEEVNRRYRERDKVKKQVKRKDKHVQHNETREMILAVTKENPDLPSYKIAKLVKEKLGKCSKNTVEKVWDEIGK